VTGSMSSRKEGSMLGPYRIVEQVGQGGMATIYKAYQPSMDRYVAVKILPAHFAHDPKFVARFNREAQTIAKLEHKNIIPVHDYGDENGVTYLVMRYLDSGTLKDVMAAGRLTIADVVEIMTQVCAALDYAHRQGVIHRDVKPANVLIDREGAAYLSDFGIARVLEGASNLTDTGGAVGTPAYMAPEQSMGGAIDARTDIYALGVILYEMLVGRPPYQADTPMAVVLAHIHEPLPSPRVVNPALPEPFEKVILKALAKDPADRYQSAGEMATALKNALAESGISTHESTLPQLAEQAREMAISRTMPAPDLQFAQGRVSTQPTPVQRSRLPLIVGGLALLLVTAVVGAVIVASILRGAAAAPEPAEIIAANETDEAVTEEPVDAVTENAPDTPEPTADPFEGNALVRQTFDDPAFEGTIDTSLWLYESFTEEQCQFIQHEGALVVTDDATASMSCVLSIPDPEPIAIEQFGTFQVDLQSESDRNQSYQEASLNMMVYQDGGSWWYARCGLSSQDDWTALHFWIVNVETDGTEQFQDDGELGAVDDRWYSLALTIDPATHEIACHADGHLIGKGIPDFFDEIPNPVFGRSLNLWRDPGAVGTQLIDNFTLLAPE
jgi:serine/threonine protein kinase